MKRFLGTLLCLALLASLVAACAPAAPTPEKPAAPAAKPAEAKPAESKAAEPKPAESRPAAEAKPAESKPAEAKSAGPAFKIRYQTTGGMGGRSPLTAIEKLGLDKKYNINIELTVAANVDGMHTAMVGGAADVIASGWTNAVLYRSRGVPLVAFWPIVGFSNDILVQKDSPIQSLADLKGKRIGSFSSPASVTTVLWRAGTTQFFGYDPVKEAKIQTGASTLLLEILGKGEIDAALLMDPQITKGISSGRFRSIADVGAIWEKNTGEKLVGMAFVANEEWVKKNPEGIRNFLRAAKEAYQYLNTNNDIWTDIGKEQFRLETPEEIDLLRKRSQGLFVTEWNDKKIEEQIKFGELAIKLFGTDFLPSAPREAFFAGIQP